MRPTIDEQLAGADRLLRLAEADPEATVAVTELVRNARRLVEGVAGSWSELLPFLETDNARTAALLGEPSDDRAVDDLAAADARNEWLRAALSRRIQEHPAGDERAAIGAHLRRRVDENPS